MHLSVAQATLNSQSSELRLLLLVGSQSVSPLLSLLKDQPWNWAQIPGSQLIFSQVRMKKMNIQWVKGRAPNCTANRRQAFPERLFAHACHQPRSWRETPGGFLRETRGRLRVGHSYLCVILLGENRNHASSPFEDIRTCWNKCSSRTLLPVPGPETLHTRQSWGLPANQPSVYTQSKWWSHKT